MASEKDKNEESVTDRLVAWRDSSDAAIPPQPTPEGPATVWLTRPECPGNADVSPPRSETRRTDRLGRHKRAGPVASGPRIIRRCVLVALLVTGVSWLLTLPVWGRGESAYAWLVVVPLHLTVFLPSLMLLRGLPSGWRGEGISLVVCTFVVNALIGLLFGVVLCEVLGCVRNGRWHSKEVQDDRGSNEGVRVQ